MTAAHPTLIKRLDEFLISIPVDGLSISIAERAKVSVADVRQMLATYMNEAKVSFALIETHLNKNLRTLEVGAGLCLTSLFLRSQGYPVTALEPALGGYGLFDVAKQTIIDHFNDIQLEVLTCPAQELSRTKHGEFSLIFSNNVMEHIPDWQSALTAMASVLAKQGIMRHSCPNYSVPYEPHYGVPVFRHLPGVSKRLFLPKTADTEIWNSLNFICYRDVKSYCTHNDLLCSFDKGLLYKALMRIKEDREFKSRHKGVIASLASLLITTGVVRLFSYIPASISTPMIFSINKPDDLAGDT